MGTHVGTVLLEKLIFPQIINNILFFMESTYLLLCSKHSIADTYSKPDESTPHSSASFL